MMIHIGYAAACLPLGFVFGFAISFIADKAMMEKWRKDSVFMLFCMTALAGACREVLADSWYNRVMRKYAEKLERRRDHA